MAGDEGFEPLINGLSVRKAGLSMAPYARGWCLLGLLVLLWPAATLCTPADTELKFPLTIPYALLGDLAWQPREGEEPAEFADGRCRRLHIDGSWLNLRNDELYLVSRGQALLGISLFGFCIKPIKWQGSVDVLLEPYIDAEWKLRFRLGKTELRDAQGEPATLLNFIGRLIRPFINRRAELFGLDLGAPREQINELLSTMVEPGGLVELQSVLASLRPGKPQVNEQGVLVEAQLTLPEGFVDRLLPPGQADEAGLAGNELTQLQLERLDAFLVAVVKLLGREITDPMLRQQLLALLLESRYRLVNILDHDEPLGEEPVRSLFISDWERLRHLLLAVDPGTITHSRLLRYASFLNAGDTLLALDAALPQLALWISRDGLRTALHELAPAGATPNLEYQYNVDPALRELFGLPPEPPPSPPEEFIEEPDEVEPTIDATPPDPEGENETPNSPDNSALRLPLWAQLLDLLVPTAEASTAVPDRVTELQRALGRRMPRRNELTSYAEQIAELLEVIGQQELATRELGKAYNAVFLDLLPATALTESCWRQFKREDGKITYLVSSAEAVGMMQVNLRVWRGLYDAERLKWEVAYNARAGAQILLHYLEGPGLDVVRQTGNPEYLAWASYAVYNAGPVAAKRFLRKRGELKPGQTDRKLLAHYQGFVDGGIADLEHCVVSQPAEATPAL